jgi:DUF4097 and DUF4098 domain-containing protein YvlB
MNLDIRSSRANPRTGDPVKEAMKTLLAAFAISALAAPAAQASGWGQETEHVSRTLKLSSGGRIRVKSFSGRVHIRATDGGDVVIDAERRATRDRLDHIKLDVYQDGSTIVIDTNHRDSSWWSFRDNVVETDLDIKVPRKVDLDVHVFSAPVVIEGVEGTHRVHGFSSRITLDDVTGPVTADTFSGPVEIRAKGWRDAQDVDVKTFSGHITLRLPESANGTVSFNSFSGRLNSAIPLTLKTSGRRNLTAELGANARSGGHLRLHTFSGNVEIDR